MPTVSIYLNKENYLKWLQLDEPSKWVASQLDKSLFNINSSKPITIETNGRPVHEAVPFDILKQGKSGRYNGDTPLVGPKFPETIEAIGKNIIEHKIEKAKKHTKEVLGRVDNFPGFISKSHSARKKK